MTNLSEQLKQYLPFLIPLAALQIGLMLAALVHILKAKRFKTGNKALWVCVALLLSTIGPVLYFALGRTDDA